MTGSGEYDEPTGAKDRLIFHFLSHGQKQLKELRGYISETRFSAQSIGDRMRELHKEEPWIAKERDGNAVYYYRPDVGRVPSIRKSSADRDEIEQLLYDLEIKLGVRSKSDSQIHVNDLSSIPELANDLLKQSNQYGQIFTTDEHVTRFFDILDALIKQIRRGYSAESPPANYPPKTYALLFTTTAKQYEGWKQGEAHAEFAAELSSRIDRLVALVNTVPEEVGTPIIRVVALADIQKAREAYKNAILSGEYSEEKLIQLAEACYAHRNDMDKLVKDLNELGGKSGDREASERINNIKHRLRLRFDL